MSDKNLNIPIENLNLTVRTYSCFKRAGYNTVEKLVEASANELLMLPHFGKKCLDEIVQKLDSLGLCLNQGKTLSHNMTEAKTLSEIYEEMQVEKWVGVDEVIEHLGICRRTVHAWIKEGKLPAHMVRNKYRFKLSEVDEWLRAGRMAED